MKQYFLFLMAGMVAVLAGCEKDPGTGNTPKDVELTITFKALYDGNRLVKNTDYSYDTYKVQFSRFATYMSDITLLNGTEEVEISDIEYLDFTPDGASDNNSVDVTIKATVKEGSYTGIRMGYGVSPDKNAKKPADFGAGTPLANEAEYWPGWKSYIFTKIEGQGDENNDGNPDIFLIYHCGSDKVYREYTYNTPVTVAGNTNVNVEFDLKNMFFTNGAWFDLTVPNNQFTSNLASDTRVAAILMDNFDDASSIK